jgi:hypothetical protein
MESSNYKKFAILYADEDRDACARFVEAFSHRFRIVTASTFQEAREVFLEERLGVALALSTRSLVSPEERPFLSFVRQQCPSVLRIELTATASPPSPEAIEANHLYLCVAKPWEPRALEVTLLRAMEFFHMALDQKRLEEDQRLVLHRLLVADKVLSLGALATDLGHHLRHVMPALQSFMDVASPRFECTTKDLKELSQPARLRQHDEFSQAQRAATKHVLGDLADSARPFLPTFNDQVQPHTCFMKAIERFNARLAEKGLRAANNIPKNLPTLKCDETLLDRMMDSLFEEALLALTPGSTLQMDGVKESNQVVRLQVSCGEPGLEPERLRWVFDPFIPATPGATQPGLHLLAAFLVVYHHGGVVHSTPQAGQGRVLRFHLPVDPDKMMMTEGARNFLNQLLFTGTMWETFLDPKR